MKNLIITSILIIGSFLYGTPAIYAQTQPMLHSNGSASKNLIGTSTDTVSTAVNYCHDNISIMLVADPSATSRCKVTAKIYGSLDGTNYDQIGSTQFTGDSSVNVNSYVWSLTSDNYAYYRIITTGAATANDTNAVTGFLTYKVKGSSVSAYRKAQTGTFTCDNVVTANTNKITNLGSDTLTYHVRGGYNSVSIQPLLTKVSGTVLAGSLLYYSEDGTNFIATGDSVHYTNTSAVQTDVINIPASTAQHEYYRVITTGYSGTQVANVSCLILGK